MRLVVGLYPASALAEAVGEGAYRSSVPVEFLSDREVAAYGR